MEVVNGMNTGQSQGGLMINNFTANANKSDATCQEELLEIRHDEESKTNFDSGSYMQLWQCQKMPNQYPNIWKIILKLLITYDIYIYIS